MTEEKLVIISKKYRGDSAVISVRLPKGLITRVDELAEETGRTRNELIQTFIEYSVDNLKIEK